MALHDFLAVRGADAVSILAIGALIAGFLRLVRRVRTSTRNAFAQSIGQEVANAMVPIVQAQDRKMSVIADQLAEHIETFNARVEVDDNRWNKTEELYKRLVEHMQAEEEKDG